jgi:hypothetical protein
VVVTVCSGVSGSYASGGKRNLAVVKSVCGGIDSGGVWWRVVVVSITGEEW